MNQENLKNRDYVLVLDKSGSMASADTKSGKSRWSYAQESTLAIANKLNEYDPDGITVVPFSSAFKVYENTTPSVVANIFAENEPMGGTVLAPVLNDRFNDYLARKAAGKTKANGEIMLIITDGEPADEADVIKAIVQFGNKLNTGDEEYGISFVQVGKDSGATAFLKRLDDDLVSKYGAKFDIVDTKTIDEVETLGLTETLIAALND